MSAKFDYAADLRSRFRESFLPRPSTGCWIWTAARDQGYGVIASDISARAHRVSWVLHCGPIPDGMVVCHKCDVRSCVNPDHLFLGTRNDNNQDCRSKDRHAKGERMGNARLSQAQVAEIDRRLRAGETATAVANSYDIDVWLVRDVGNGTTWGWLTGRPNRAHARRALESEKGAGT